MDAVGTGADWEAPLFEVGPWLWERRSLMDTNESAWLDVLADFDRDEGWSAEGQLNCAAWLQWRCGMARSTAYEKLRMAHQLAKRSVVHDAFAEGEISYSATRAILSIDDASVEVDQALVDLARSASIADVEAAVRYYQCLAGQEAGGTFTKPDRRDLYIQKGHHGLGVLKVTLSNDELEIVDNLVRAFMNRREESAAADGNGARETQAGAAAGNGAAVVQVAPDPTPAESAAADGNDMPVAGPASAGMASAGSGEAVALVAPVPDPAESAAADGNGAPEDEDKEPFEVSWRFTYGQARADAFMDACAVALAHIGDGHAVGADRYMVHVVADVTDSRWLGDSMELLDGSPVPAVVAERLSCDATLVAHLVSAGSEPLYLGRRVRDWSPAQRRAIRVRDRGRCRFPGCHRGITDIHHVLPWSEGGTTDVANGCLLCTRHHTIVHQGFRVEGNANEALSFLRPGGSLMATSAPPASRPGLFRDAALAAAM